MQERKNVITMKGNPLTLEGNEVKVGNKAPDAELVDNELNKVSLATFKGKNLLILTVPSLDTSVCSTETRRFNKEVSTLGSNFTTIVISNDLPFAQKRWCATEGVKNLKIFSDYNGHDFGKKWGVFIKEIALLARAAFIVDSEGIVRYTHIVKEVTSEPPYDEIVAQAKDLLSNVR